MALLHVVVALLLVLGSALVIRAVMQAEPPASRRRRPRPAPGRDADFERHRAA